MLCLRPQKETVLEAGLAIGNSWLCAAQPASEGTERALREMLKTLLPPAPLQSGSKVAKETDLGADISCYPILTFQNRAVPGMCQGEEGNQQHDLAQAIVESQRAAL